MTDKELMQQALEALECIYSPLYVHEINKVGAAIAALRERLAQPEQETQAYREAAQLAKWLFKKHYAQEEHYASGRVVWGLCDTTAGVISQIDNMVCKLVLPKEPEQRSVSEHLEPVAWRNVIPGGRKTDEWGSARVADYNQGWNDYRKAAKAALEKLYTTPPQRKPLTEEEPFGYFRPEPFGWTDCAETDEGAVALYEQPPQRKPLTDEEIGTVLGFGEYTTASTKSTLLHMARAVIAKATGEKE